MTRDDIIEMARKAGFAHSWSEAAGEALERFAALVRTAALEDAAQRQPLTDGEIEREWQFLHDEEGNPPDHHEFVRAIEAAHGITKGST